MTCEICQPIIRHSYDKELFLYLLNKKWKEVLIKRTSDIQKNGYYATSYIWGSRVLNLERSTSIEMYGSCSLESQWKLIAVLHTNSNLTLNRQQTLSFHQDVDKEWQLKVFAQYPSLKVKISIERSVPNWQAGEWIFSCFPGPVLIKGFLEWALHIPSRLETLMS